MSQKPPDDLRSPEADPGRRKFLKKGGALLAAGAVLSSLPSVAGSDRDEGSEEERVTHKTWKRPNLLILITDQERYPQHWPEGWADANLPNRKRLSDRGLTFDRAFCASSMCTPSRATLFTGLYPPEHGVTQTLRFGTVSQDTSQHTLPLPTPERDNLATMLAKAGYDVQYRGKWHISKDPSGIQGVVSPRDLEQYGFHGWIPPDGGTDQSPAVFGGGNTDYDAYYTDHAVEFLQNAKAHSEKPFALILCLINPHDIMSYPGVPPVGWDAKSLSDIQPFKDMWNYRGIDFDAPPLGQVPLPLTYWESPEGNGKPAAQAQSTRMWADDRLCGPIDTEDAALEYVRFYAYLHMRSDIQLGRVLDALESRESIHKNTLVIRLADHGEMGLAHGGMRQKAYSAYEETIHVPLVISNPRLFPRPVRTAALASLVDLMPTLATIADAPGRATMTFRGKDLTPILKDAVDHPDQPPRPVQNSVLFTTDENLGTLTQQVPNTTGDPYVQEPSRIRCLREERWKIVMYFDATDPANEAKRVYELYDLLEHPPELNNRADSNPDKLAEMKAKLEARMEETHTVPAVES